MEYILKTVKFHFLFKNEWGDHTKVWLAKPPNTQMQTVHEIKKNCKQLHINKVDENVLEYYTLDEGEEIEKYYEVELYSPSDKVDNGELSEEEREFYLRSTSWVRINEEITQLANQLCSLNTSHTGIDRNTHPVPFKYISFQA